MAGFFEGATQGLDKGMGLGVQLYRDAMAQKQAERERVAQEKLRAEEKERLLRKEETEQSRFEREMALKERALNQKPGGGILPAGLKLKPGERYNPTTDTVEVVPGSDLYQAQSSKHAADLQAMQAAQEKAKGGIGAVDEFLKRPGGVESQFGKGFSGLVTRFTDPGAGKQLEQIKSTIRSAGLDMMRQGGSIGTMTEREWPMVENMISALDNTISEEDARLQLEKIKAKLDGIQRRAQETYQTEWGASPFAKQVPQQAPAPMGGDQEAKMRRLQELRAKRGM